MWYQCRTNCEVDAGPFLQSLPDQGHAVSKTHSTRRGDRAMPKARSAGQCDRCEAEDRVRMTFMTCNRCHRYFCSEHGTPELDQCEACIEGGEETE
jgi:hypothetical protein